MKMSLFLMAIAPLLTHRFLSLTSHLSSLKCFFFFISSSPLCFPHFLVCFEHQHTCFPLNLMSSLQLFQLVHLSRPNNQQTQKSCAVSQCIPLEPVTCAPTFAADVIRGFARHSDLQRRYNLPVYVPHCNYLCFVLVCLNFKSFVVKDVAECILFSDDRVQAQCKKLKWVQHHSRIILSQADRWGLERHAINDTV